MAKAKKEELPEELKKALEKVADRPDENTPACIMNFLNDETSLHNLFIITQIVEYVDEDLLDMDLDEKYDNPIIYHNFALEVALKIMGLVSESDTTKNKPLEFYDNNEKIYKLKVKDFKKLGDLSDKSNEEKQEILSKFYGVEDDEKYKKLTQWEKTLFVAKALNREDTNLEKK